MVGVSGKILHYAAPTATVGAITGTAVKEGVVLTSGTYAYADA